MSKARVSRSNLLELIDSDSEDGLNGNTLAIAKPPATKKTAKKSPTTTMPPKGARGRPAANKVTKPAQQKASTRRTNGRLAAAIEQAVEEDDRAALEEKSTNTQPKMPGRGRKKAVPAVEDDEDVDMEDVPEEPVPKPKTARGRPKKAAEAATVNGAAKPARPPPGRKAAAKHAIEEEAEVSEIPETQQPEPVPDAMEEEDQLEDLPPRQFSDHLRMPSSPSKRPGYSSSSDGGGEPALRRKLGEMTQKFESLDQKYRDLKEVAVREAERNFDRLKKQTDEKAKAADQLIASLKAELAAQKEEAKEAARLKKQLEAGETKVDEMQARLTSLTTSLSESRTEIKALNMKLTAARSAEASALAKSVPGSAMKGSTASLKASAASTQQAALLAQMKEDLYSDLTGLIVRSVKRDGGEDVYDCLQTGRNGTLHFKLAIPNDTAADNFEDAQFLYMPQLDPNRDRSLIDILPDYLVEEITFPRPHAAKFYARVMKALTEPPQA